MLYVGQVITGYCGGVFGRDSYGPKRVEASGYDWVVVRDEDGVPAFASSPGHSIYARLVEVADSVGERS